LYCGFVYSTAAREFTKLKKEKNSQFTYNLIMIRTSPAIRKIL